VVLAGASEGEFFKLKAGTTHVIGRAEDCDMRLDDEGVSRQHARVVVEEGAVVLEDLDSRNGTFVGQDKITKRTLVAEDVVRIGRATMMKFCFLDPIEEQSRRRMVVAALRDPLTGVYNRRHFDERLLSECAGARRHERLLCLLMVDVDDFKRVNDQHGHLAGDAVLRGVAHTLVQSARDRRDRRPALRRTPP
jgi:hypothetical protein